MIKNLIPPYTPGTEGKGGKNQVDDILSIHHNIRSPSAQKNSGASSVGWYEKFISWPHKIMLFTKRVDLMIATK